MSEATPRDSAAVLAPPEAYNWADLEDPAATQELVSHIITDVENRIPPTLLDGAVKILEMGVYDSFGPFTTPHQIAEYFGEDVALATDIFSWLQAKGIVDKVYTPFNEHEEDGGGYRVLATPRDMLPSEESLADDEEKKRRAFYFVADKLVRQGGAPEDAEEKAAAALAQIARGVGGYDFIDAATLERSFDPEETRAILDWLQGNYLIDSRPSPVGNGKSFRVNKELIAYAYGPQPSPPDPRANKPVSDTSSHQAQPTKAMQPPAAPHPGASHRADHSGKSHGRRRGPTPRTPKEMAELTGGKINLDAGPDRDHSRGWGTQQMDPRQTSSMAPLFGYNSYPPAHAGRRAEMTGDIDEGLSTWWPGADPNQGEPIPGAQEPYPADRDDEDHLATKPAQGDPSPLSHPVNWWPL